MKSLSVKEYRSLIMPTEEVSVSNQSRILPALGALGYEQVTIPRHILRIRYPMRRSMSYVRAACVVTSHAAFFNL